MSETEKKTNAEILLTPVKVLEGNHKKVIATSVFMSLETENFVARTYEDIYFGKYEKPLLYFTGLIKTISRFRKTMPVDWIYRIYIDEMFMSTVEYTDPIYEISPNDSNYHKLFKTNVVENKIHLNRLLVLCRNYIKHILDNPEKYPFVEIISYSLPRMDAVLKDKYLGYPQTFGSIVRLLAAFDSSVDTVFFVNSSHPINPLLAKVILAWEKSKYQGISMFDPSYYGFSVDNISKKLLSTIRYLEITFDEIKNRLPAGLTGLKKHPDILVPDAELMVNSIIADILDDIEIAVCEDNEVFTNDTNAMFAYGIDEVILTKMVRTTSPLMFQMIIDSQSSSSQTSSSQTSSKKTSNDEDESLNSKSKRSRSDDYTENNTKSEGNYCGKCGRYHKINDDTRDVIRENVKYLSYVRNKQFIETLTDYYYNIYNNNSSYHRFMSRRVNRWIGYPISTSSKCFGFQHLLMNISEIKPLKLVTFNVPVDGPHFEFDSTNYTYVSLGDPNCLSTLISYYANDANYDEIPSLVVDSILPV